MVEVEYAGVFDKSSLDVGKKNDGAEALFDKNFDTTVGVLHATTT